MAALVDLDARCGRRFKYRDLIECSDTWKAHARTGAPIDNMPMQSPTLVALATLCDLIVDPLTEAFALPMLSYGFASHRLTASIRKGIAPRLDQHAGHEVMTDGKLICSRRGAAVDMRVPGTASTTVANWLIENTPFDRLYFYGDDRPVHVSWGPENSRAAFEMVRSSTGVLVPRPYRRERVSP